MKRRIFLNRTMFRGRLFLDKRGRRLLTAVFLLFVTVIPSEQKVLAKESEELSKKSCGSIVWEDAQAAFYAEDFAFLYSELQALTEEVEKGGISSFEK